MVPSTTPALIASKKWLPSGPLSRSFTLFGKYSENWLSKSITIDFPFQEFSNSSILVTVYNFSTSRSSSLTTGRYLTDLILEFNCSKFTETQKIFCLAIFMSLIFVTFYMKFDKKFFSKRIK